MRQKRDYQGAYLPSLGFPPYRKFETYTDAFRFMFLINFPWSLLIYFIVPGTISVGM
ncbi:MAG: hypothetical protein ACR2F2_04480 [Pyrinomonadaceae bacterium]